jgi:hypothetical protein
LLLGPRVERAYQRRNALTPPKFRTLPMWSGR